MMPIIKPQIQNSAPASSSNPVLSHCKESWVSHLRRKEKGALPVKSKDYKYYIQITAENPALHKSRWNWIRSEPTWNNVCRILGPRYKSKSRSSHVQWLMWCRRNHRNLGKEVRKQSRQAPAPCRHTPQICCLVSWMDPPTPCREKQLLFPAIPGKLQGGWCRADITSQRL